MRSNLCVFSLAFGNTFSQINVVLFVYSTTMLKCLRHVKRDVEATKNKLLF